MSSSFGGSSSGNINFAITVDDAQAIQKLQSVGQQLTTLGQAGQQTAQDLQQLPQALDQSTQSVGQFSQANADMAAELQATDIGVKEVSTSTQGFGSILKNNISAVVGMASGILGIVSAYTGLQRTQLAINKLSVTEANQTRLLGVLHRKYAEAVAEEGAQSQKALDIKAKIDILEQKNINTKEQLSIRQEQQTQQQIAFGISIVQTGAQLVQTASSLKGYGGAATAAATATNTLSMSMNKLKIATVIGAILVAIEIAAQAVANNFMGLRDWLDNTYNSLVKLAPAFRPVIDALYTVGEFLTALFTGDLNKIGEMIKGQTAEAVTGIDNLTEATIDAGKAANESRESYEEWLSTGFDAFKELTSQKKGDRKDILEFMGIKGDSADKLNKFMGKMDKTFDTLEGFHQAIQTMETLDLLNKMGFKVPDHIWKDIAYTFEDRFNEIGKMVKGEDVFEQFADVLHDAAPHGGQAIINAIMSFTEQHPDFMEDLSRLEPDLWKDLQELFKNSGAKVNPFEGIIFDPGVTFEENSKILQNLHHDKGDQPENKITGFLDKITTAIKTYDWKGAADSIVQGILTFPANLVNVATKIARFSDTIVAGIVTGMLITGPKAIAEWVTKTFTWANVSSALGIITQFGIDALSAVIDAMRDPAALAIAVSDFVTDVLTQIGTWFVTNMPETAEVLKTVGESLLNNIYLGIIAYTNFGSEALNWMKEQLIAATSLENILKAGTIIAGAIMLGLQKLTDFGKTAIDWMAGQITSAAKGLWQAGKDMGGQLWEGIKNFFSLQTLADLIAQIGLGITPPQSKGGSNEEMIPDPNNPGFWIPNPKYNKKTSAGDNGNYTGQGGFNRVGMMLPGFGPTDILNTIGKTYDWIKNGGVDQIKDALTGDLQEDAYRDLQMQLKAGNIIKGLTPVGTPISKYGTTEKQTVAAGGFNAAEAGVTWGNVSLQQKQNVAGAGQFAGMTTEASSANKAIQTEFSVMWTAVTQIMTNLGTHWSGIMNSLGANAKSGGNQIVTAIGSALVNVAQGMATLASAWSSLSNSFGKNAQSAGNQISDGIGSGLIMVAQAMSELAKGWSKLANSLGKNAKSAGNQISDGVGAGLIMVAQAMSELAKGWSKICNSLGKNAKSGGSQIYKALNQALENVAGVMNKFAKHWSSVCNSLIKNAKSAASGINSALSKIKDQEVVITYRYKTVGSRPSGTTRIGTGGLIRSAAEGYVTHGPELVLVGDNPGGRETIAVIPHNNPRPTLGMIGKEFGQAVASQGGGNQPIIINAVLQIDGNEIVNTRNIKKMMRLEVGQNRDKFGA